jgi:hypothetical protein
MEKCETPKEDDYEDLHVALLRDDVVKDASSVQQVLRLVCVYADRRIKHG